MSEKNQKTEQTKTLKQDQDDIVIQYLPAVRAMSFRLKGRLPSSIDVNDLISIGIEEMVKLSKKYDKVLNNSFWGYAKKRVYGSMLDYLRSLDVISRNNRRLVKAIDNEITKCLMENGTEPDDFALAVALNESLDKIREARAASESSISIPLNEHLITTSTINTEDLVEQDQLIESVKNILTKLNDREQTIIQLYYFEELSLKEISSILDISESRISQVHKKLMIQIKGKLVT